MKKKPRSFGKFTYTQVGTRFGYRWVTVLGHVWHDDTKKLRRLAKWINDAADWIDDDPKTKRALRDARKRGKK